MSINWFLANARQRAPRAHLFCLPYAGGGASVYRGWDAALGGDVDVLSAQLAGRGWRLREAPLTDLGTLAGQLAEAIVAKAEAPVAVFGHSMGAWVGLEVVRRLEAAGLEPLLFFASGRQAPGLGCTQPRMSHLDDAEFVHEVQTRYGGIPHEILGEPDLLSLLLPALRADIRLLELYEHCPRTPIATPIHALVGAADEVVSVAEMAPWVDETRGEFSMTTLPGGHFYFQPDPRSLLDIIHDRLSLADGRLVCRGAGV